MKKIVVAVIAAVALFGCVPKALGNSTNVAAGPKFPFLLIPEKKTTNTLEFNFPLEKSEKDWIPFQSRMDFDSIKISAHEGMDIFDMDLAHSKTQNFSFGWFVHSRYPIDSTGPRTGWLGAGIELRKKFGRKH